MAEEKSVLDGGLLEINPDAGFGDLMKAWPKEPLYRKEEPPVSPESLHNEVFNKKQKKKKH